MSTAEQYQKLESESSQGEIPSDAIPKDGSVLTDSQKASLEGQEIIMGQVVSMPAAMVSGNPEAMTRHTSTASHQHPINPGAPRRPPNGGYYEMAHYQTVNQGQPPAYSANSSDPEIGLPNDSSQLLEYHELYRAGRPGCWRPFVGLLGLGCGVSFLCALILLYLFIIIYNIVGSTFDPQIEEGMELTPDTLAYANLVLASAIPVAGYLTQELHGVHYGWLSSVVRKIRWSWLRTCLVLSAIVLFVTMLVSAALSAMTSTSVEATGNDEVQVNEWTDQTTSFLFVVLLLTPLQAAGEEYAFRGYLTQAFGGLCSKWIAIFVPSFLFALAHGSQTGPVFFDRFAFGFVSGLLVVETGGLEAGIAMHILNNFAAFGWAILFGDITSAMEPSSENWWGIIVTLTQSVGYFVLARKMARRKNIQTSVSKMTVQGLGNQANAFYPVPMVAP